MPPFSRPEASEEEQQWVVDNFDVPNPAEPWYMHPKSWWVWNGNNDLGSRGPHV